jgi:hypothetical protein
MQTDMKHVWEDLDKREWWSSVNDKAESSKSSYVELMHMYII